MNRNRYFELGLDIANLLDFNVGTRHISLDAIIQSLDTGPTIEVRLNDPEPVALGHGQGVLRVSLEIKQRHGQRLLTRGRGYDWACAWGRGRWWHILD